MVWNACQIPPRCAGVRNTFKEPAGGMWGILNEGTINRTEWPFAVDTDVTRKNILNLYVASLSARAIGDVCIGTWGHYCMGGGEGAEGQLEG